MQMLQSITLIHIYASRHGASMPGLSTLGQMCKENQELSTLDASHQLHHLCAGKLIWHHNLHGINTLIDPQL